MTTRKAARDSTENDDNSNQKVGVADKEVDEVVFKLVDGAVVKIIVKTGISDYQRIEVIEGLNDGEEIVSGPFLAVSKRLKDGDKVTVTNKKAEKKSVASTE